MRFSYVCMCCYVYYTLYKEEYKKKMLALKASTISWAEGMLMMRR